MRESTILPTGVSTIDRATAVRGDRDADFAAYMAARQPSLLRTAYLLSGDRHTAEDLVQTTLAKLYLSWDKVRDQDALDGYVRRILVNEHRSLWRRAWKRKEQASDALPEQPYDDVLDDGLQAALWAFVQTLPRKQRAVVVLRYYEDMSEAEIAQVLGISPGTVKSQASRALAALRGRIDDSPGLADVRVRRTDPPSHTDQTGEEA